MGKEEPLYGPEKLTIGQVLRRAGYAPSSEILFPPQEDDPPQDDLTETWIPMTYAPNGAMRDSVLPYNHDPKKIAQALAIDLEDIPRALVLEYNSMALAIMQSRLAGLL